MSLVAAIALASALCCAVLLILILSALARMERKMLNDNEKALVATMGEELGLVKQRVDVLEASNADLKTANTKLLEVNAALTAKLGDGVTVDPALANLATAIAALVPAAPPANDPTPPPAAA